jgi:hypothetical protein
LNTIKMALATFAASAALLAALPASAIPNSLGGKVYPIRPVNGSGEYGTVALKPLGQKTEVEVHVVNTPPGDVQTIHIHHGTCAHVQPPVIYPLAPLVDGTSESVVEAPLWKILAIPSVLHVHSSYKNEHRSVACANLAPR